MATKLKYKLTHLFYKHEYSIVKKKNILVRKGFKSKAFSAKKWKKKYIFFSFQ